MLSAATGMGGMAMAGMGTPVSSAAAFWQARQLPHMNNFNMNMSMNNNGSNVHGLNPGGGGVHHPGVHHVGHHHQQQHDAKMAEKIVSELQVAK